MKIIVSEDQNRVTIDGTVTTFKEIKLLTRGTCGKCWLNRFTDDCSLIPCCKEERQDGREGVFTIQNMPK